MIFYFSGTGNSKWVAENLAQKLNDRACDITTTTNLGDLRDEKQIGLVFPIYAWDVPEPMLMFIKQLPKTTTFTFGVCTCGADAGLAMKNLSKIIPLKSAYSLSMPSNYIVGADVESDEVILGKLKNAKEEITRITEEIIAQTPIYRVHEGSAAFLKSIVLSKGFNKFARSSKPFYSLDICNSCGLCEKNCPAKTIKLVNGKPIRGDKCYQCLMCINKCPQKAIQYGKKTETYGRYDIDNYIEKI